MSYLGMNSMTGRYIMDIDHIRQSLQDILTTPIGARIERREYGSVLHFLIDQPNNAALRLKMISAIVIAIQQWEKRISLQSVEFEQQQEKLTVSIIFTRRDKTQHDQHQLSIEVM